MISVFPALEEDLDRSLQVVSYNIHRCFGLDKCYRPDRIVSVLRDLKADLIGLQEVDTRVPAGVGPDGSEPIASGMNQLDYMAFMLKVNAIAGPCIREDHGHYGNALLTRLPVTDVRSIDLSVQGREPRGALDIDVNVAGRVLRVIVTHLGCRAFERRRQIGRLLAYIGHSPKRPTLIMGDFNEWSPLSRGIRTINAHFGLTSARPSFPSRWPVFSLDRIWVLGGTKSPLFRINKSPLARVASDHLPVSATIHI